MSEEQSDREWRFYLEDMMGFCERVQNFTRDSTQEEFLDEQMRYDATVRNIYSISISMRYVVASPCRAAALSAASRLISHRSGNGIS